MNALRAAWGRFEQRACRRWHAFGGRRPWRPLFAAVSRLGNGVFWYVLMAVLALADGAPGRETALRMLFAGALTTLAYTTLKNGVRRVRPCDALPDLAALVAPLDRFSFPSGHTMHAVAFTTVALAAYPALAWLLIPFTLLVAASRLVLGLHYPSDVLAGAGLGLAVARLTLAVP